MKNNYLAALLLMILLAGCATTRELENSPIRLTYLDDFVLEQPREYDSLPIGGLSGIDFQKGRYFLVSDHPGNPRIYTAEIPLINRSIDTVLITGMIQLDRKDPFYQEHTPDLEGIRFEPETGELVLSAEGAIKTQKDPAIFHINENGKRTRSYQLPRYFKASGAQRPRNNGALEGLARSFDGTGYWAAMELPLEKDGPAPKIYSTNSPVRITKFNRESGTPEKQFAYKLERVGKFPVNWFAVNGVTEILEIAEGKFLVLERAFSAGYGSQGNTVRIFLADATQAENTLEMDSLKRKNLNLADKQLIFNFKSVRKFLDQEIVDNIEGMTLGPVLPNGNQSLILVSDDNFSNFGYQITQFILMEINTR